MIRAEEIFWRGALSFPAPTPFSTPTWKWDYTHECTSTVTIQDTPMQLIIMSLGIGILQLKSQTIMIWKSWWHWRWWWWWWCRLASSRQSRVYFLHFIGLCVVGAFRVEMSKMPTSDRSIQCRYYPTEIGVYCVYVLWSGEHVPGSPFRVHIVDTVQELRNLAEQSEITVGPDNLCSFDTTDRAGWSKTGPGNTLRGLIYSDDV